jgi:beta-fructofuranosidase
MLLCTRKKTGPDRMRGATGLLKSNDLDHWEYCGSFWDPSNCWCPECPDLFKWGKYWYFIYSTFNEAEGLRTYYRMAETLAGPWKAPNYNTFDGRAFYAGKTAFDGEKRYIFGWNPTRTGDVDSGVWQWGGCLVAHELIQLPNGELRVNMPKAINDLFGEATKPQFKPMLKQLEQTEDSLILTAESGFGTAVSEPIPETCMIQMDIWLEPGTRDAGLVLHADEAGDEGYYLRLEAMHSKLVFDRTHRVCEHIDIERYADIATGCWHSLTILLDGTAVTAYLDDTVALSARMYDYTGNRIIPFVSDGIAKFRNLRISELRSCEEA